jgi:cyd operon protein YbgT
MWYFSWILGTGLALAFGVLNAMWYELTQGESHGASSAPTPPRVHHHE